MFTFIMVFWMQNIKISDTLELNIMKMHLHSTNLYLEEERMQSSNPDSEGSENFPVRCPCGVSCDHGLMILCDICQKWQHGVSGDVPVLYYSHFWIPSL